MKTYYLVVTNDTTGFINCQPEAFWTDSEYILKLFLDEYEYIAENSVVLVYENTTVENFLVEATYDSHLTITDFNELYLVVSEYDSDTYHVSAPSIDDMLLSGGNYDGNYQWFLQRLVRCGLNAQIISKYIRDERLVQMIKLGMYKYIMQFILLQQSTIDDYCDIISENESAVKFLSFMGIDPNNPRTYQDGIFEIVDSVKYDRIMSGVDNI